MSILSTYSFAIPLYITQGEMMNRQPYIGINGLGVTDIAPTTTAIQPYKTPHHEITYGVQVSTTTQLLDMQNKYGHDWYPVGKELTTWFYNLRDATYSDGVVHINSDNAEPLALLAFTKYILRKTSILAFDESELGSTYCSTQYLVNGIQLNNLPWDSVDYAKTLERINTMQNGPTLRRIILQANGRILTTVTPEYLAKQAAFLGAYISHVLLDGSGGNGVPLDSAKLIPFIDTLLSNEISVGIAGGLSPTTVNELAAPLLNRYPTLSIDAETGLRDNYDKSNPAASHFSTEKAVNFVKYINDILN